MGILENLLDGHGVVHVSTPLSWRRSMSGHVLHHGVANNLREFRETTFILAPGAKTREVGVAFADTVSGGPGASAESGSVYREGRGIL